MLVLTRKSGQRLIIADNIEIVIIETKGDAVKIGIEAPKNISVYRKEIYDEIKKTNIESQKEVKLADIDDAMKLLTSKAPAEKTFYGKFPPIIKNQTDKNK